MKTLKSREIIKTIAREEEVSIEDVERVIMVHFEFVKYVQSTLVDRGKGYFPSVRLPKFGIFYVPPKSQEKLMEVNKRNGTV